MSNRLFEGRRLVIATMHRKEQVLAPLLEQQLGVTCFLPPDLNTDMLGTFSGEIERTEDPLTTARLKCKLAMERINCDLAVATEGSFGPHPSVYFIPAHDELVVLIDRCNDLEIVARTVSTETNFAGSELKTVQELYQFADQVKFPNHAIILKNTCDQWRALQKGITDWDDLLETFLRFQIEYGSVFAETDMRAQYNPLRMAVIETTTRKLIELVQSTCPRCNTPGFGITDVRTGLPCSLCGSPTRSVRSHIYTCKKCSHLEEIEDPHQKQTEDPMYCDVCNP